MSAEHGVRPRAGTPSSCPRPLPGAPRAPTRPASFSPRSVDHALARRPCRCGRPTSASTPRPVREAKRAARGTAMPRAAPPRRSPGPADAPSSPPPPRRARAPRRSSRPPRRRHPRPRARPLVSVPVLSKSTTSTLRASSSAMRSCGSAARARAERGGDRRHERDGEAECVRAGDDEHRDDALEHEARVIRTEEPPADERERRRGQRHVEQPRGRPVGEDLRAATCWPARRRPAA